MPKNANFLTLTCESRRMNPKTAQFSLQENSSKVVNAKIEQITFRCSMSLFLEERLVDEANGQAQRLMSFSWGAPLEIVGKKH